MRWFQFMVSVNSGEFGEVKRACEISVLWKYSGHGGS